MVAVNFIWRGKPQYPGETTTTDMLQVTAKLYHVASHCQALSHNVVSNTPRCERGSNKQL